jgi:hypothetical protein
MSSAGGRGGDDWGCRQPFVARKTLLYAHLIVYSRLSGWWRGNIEDRQWALSLPLAKEELGAEVLALRGKSDKTCDYGILMTE